MTVTRREVLAQRLHDVHERIEAARIAASRTEDDDQVQLVVVTKTFPASDISLLAELGVTDVGENRDQEGRAKRSGVGSDELRWHMIGRLQRNKVSSVARWADIVESIDRHELIAPLAGAVERFDRKPVQVLLQVSLDPMPDPGRGGIDPIDVESLAEAVAGHEALHLAGVMAVAPHPDTGVNPRAAFDRLYEISALVRASWPNAWEISAGMSSDLEAGAAAGATQVRIGGAILGERPPVQ